MTTRLLQVTDCHLVSEAGREIYGVDPYRALQSVLRAALASAEPPELVVATGDLSEDGSEGSYRRLRALFLEAALPVYVIAGNHDSADAMRRLLPGGPIEWARCVDLPAWRLVLLDSTVPGEPHGYLSAAELDYLAGVLAQDPARPVVICLHHSPTRPCPHSGCHLRNDDELEALLDAHANARVVLSGHSHLELERRGRHTTFLTTPASCAQCSHAQPGEPVDHEDFGASHAYDARRQGCRLVTLHDDGRFEAEVRWLDKASWAGSR